MKLAPSALTSPDRVAVVALAVEETASGDAEILKAGNLQHTNRRASEGY
jgi:hypothetical protein